MEAKSIEKLKKIIEAREQRNYLAGGEVFTVWGLLNIAAVLIYAYFCPVIWVWLIMIIAGVSFQLFFLRYTEKKEGCVVLWQRNISQIWLIVVLSLPLIFFVFPQVFQIYPKIAVFPLINLGISFGLFATAFIINHYKKLFYFSALVFLSSSLLTAAFPLLFALIYSGAMGLGFVLPGLLGKFLGKKKNA